MNSTLIKVYGFFAGIALLAFLISGTLAHAQAPAASGLTTNDQSRIINLASNMTVKIEATNERLEKIADKLKYTLGWMKDDWGLEFPETNQDLVTFEQILAENRAMSANIHQEVYNAVTSTNPKAQWPEVRSKYIKMQTDLITAFEILVKNATIMETAEINWYASSTSSGTSPASTNTNATTTNL